ncbi:MAG: hypothetical protein ABR591_02610 [Candidatus Velthaea sp.]
MTRRIRILLTAFSITLAALRGQPAAALPLFAHEYGLSCQKCHSAIPALNQFGRAFLATGYRLEKVQPGPAFPVSLKINLAYTSEPDPGLPRAAVDEIEFLTGGRIGSRVNYFLEHYAVDGGVPGTTREAWVNYWIGADAARIPMSVRAGQFTLPLPVDPESFRETANHYAVFDQTVGRNPFRFFEPKAGVSVHAGRFDRGLSLDVSALRGHDVQSGLPAAGTDLMTALHQTLGRFEVTAYRYAGRRDIAPGTADGSDRFTRTGFGLRYERGRWTSENVIQMNADTNADGAGTAVRSSGGFTQLRYAFTPKLFGLVRYDGTSDAEGLFRSTTALVGYRVARNARLTIEDVVTHVPAAHHRLNAQLTAGY